MQIQPVSYKEIDSGKIINTPKISNKPEYKIIQNNDVFQPSFKGYERMLENVCNMDFKNDRAVEETFAVLFHELIKEPNIAKHESFQTLTNLYKKSGFRGLLQELWRPNPSPEIGLLVTRAEQEEQTLISKNKTTLLEIFSFGKHGFWNSIFNRKNAPRDTRLAFVTPKEDSLFEFGLDKHGAVQICQKRADETVYTTFHRATGNRKIVARHPHKYGNSETYYFKPDGTDDALKNHIQGGPVINIW